MKILGTVFKFCGFGILSLSSPEALFPSLLDGNLASFWLPIGPHERPKSSQHVSKTAPRGSKTPPSRLLELPRTPARAPRSPPELPRSLQETPETFQGPILIPQERSGARFSPPRVAKLEVHEEGSAGSAQRMQSAAHLPVCFGVLNPSFRSLAPDHGS